MKFPTSVLAIAGLFPVISMAQESEVQDMSDPTAVYTQAGAGLTNRGINLKVGDSYDTGNPDTMAMNVFELKGFWGDTFGWDNPRSQGVDSARFRNFELNLTNGRGNQIDANYNRNGNALAEANLDVSYSVIQALPPVGPFNFYPLAGLGMAMGKNAEEDDGRIDSGYSIMGFNGLVGTYIKFAITDKMWLNYNPFYFAAISGSDNYEESAYGPGNDSVLTHEFAWNYQFTPVFNVRYFANWSEYVDFDDGDHRIEFNYQL